MDNDDRHNAFDMTAPEAAPKLHKYLHQLASDLRGLADRLMVSPVGSCTWIDQTICGLLDVDEDLHLLKSEVVKGLGINEGACSALFRGYSDRRGLAMLSGALQTLSDSHLPLAQALKQLMPARYWREIRNGQTE